MPARLFGLDGQLGTVQEGRIADLTVVRGDPFTDFATLVDTPLVLRDGVPYRQSDLVATFAAGPAPAPPEGTDWRTVGRALRAGHCCHPGER